MKIKKPANTQVKTAPKSGGATIADRFKLDNGADDGKPTVGKTALTWAFSFGLVGLAGAIALAAMLYDHWDLYMQPNF